MHAAIFVLIAWNLLGGMAMACIVAAPILIHKKGPTIPKVFLAACFGPAMWSVALLASVTGAVMALRHRMQRGRPLVPPRAPLKGG